MEIVTTMEQDIAVLNVSGRMDAVNSGQYNEVVESLLNDGCLKVVADLSGLEYISSAGLRSILMGGKLIAGKSAKFALCGLSGMVKEVFEVSGFSTMFTVLEAKDEAVANLEA